MSATTRRGDSRIALPSATQTALAELLLILADDEFVLGFWDSEWTGIAPMLEEDVAFSSLAQDEIGHARVLYEILAELTHDTADHIAYGRQPEEYRHARLMDYPRTDWAFSIARRFLYDTADAARLDVLANSSYPLLAGIVSKIRREETYHRMHMEAWVKRLAEAGGEAHQRLADALELLWPDALTIFTPLDGEEELLNAGILPEPLMAIQQRWLGEVAPLMHSLNLPFPFRGAGGGRYAPTFPITMDGGRTAHSDAFRWLWNEFTLVYRAEPGAEW
ncbi:MAG: phenylacetate-CoA oxygenase subunit PaaC [Chloroflexota bacterium]|nr:phenylacetate-CoA oxygenase subunit PaaC [Chloroflexota bacterium]